MRRVPSAVLAKLLARAAWRRSGDVVNIERWFALPWRWPPAAASLAASLCRFVLPDSPQPHTSLRQPATFGLPDDVHDRGLIERALQPLEMLGAGAGEPAIVKSIILADGGQLDPVWLHASAARAYCILRDWGDQALAAGAGFCLDPSLDNKLAVRWFAAGRAVRDATAILQKWIAQSLAGGDGFNPILSRIVYGITSDCPELEEVRIARLVANYRFQDVRRGQPSTEEQRVAFMAAWVVGACRTAYSLVEERDDLCEEDQAAEAAHRRVPT